MRRTFSLLFQLCFWVGVFCMAGSLKAYGKSDKIKPVCYYMDADYGNDNNDGVSEATAWQTLGRLEDIRLHPGDRLLFKRGDVFKGQLKISARGTERNPVVIGAYGQGEKKPVLSAPDFSEYTLHVINSEFLTLEHLEIVNFGSTQLENKVGIRLEAKDFGVSKGITLDDLTIRDVNGSEVKPTGGSGIYIVNRGKKISTFDGLTIKYCHFKNCQRNALTWSGYWDRRNWHPNRNVLITHNLIEGTCGDGFVPVGCDGAIIEYNLMRGGIASLPVGSSEAAAGMWPFACDNTIMRFNESCDNKAPWDSQGFDIDCNCKNTVLEYNYSHDNYGGMALVCTNLADGESELKAGNVNSTLRYNVSIGDGTRPYPTRGAWFSPGIHIGGPVKGCTIYRNIIRNKVKAGKDYDKTMISSLEWNGYADSTTVVENIFYAPETSDIELTKSTNNDFRGNFYLGEYGSLPEGEVRGKMDAEYEKTIKDPGPDGIMQLMDSVTVANRQKCVFVSKKKIEKFFKKITRNKTNHTGETL